MKAIKNVVNTVNKIKVFHLIIGIALTAVYFTVFSLMSNFSDRAELTRDTWSYQSIAVNFANGHGFHRSGLMDEFSEYKFEKGYDVRYFDKFTTHGGIIDLHRNIGYPLFLSFIYTVFGVSPIAAKFIQLLLLCFVAGFLPWIGSKLWPRWGLLAGIISGLVFIVSDHGMAGEISTMSLTVFAIFIILIGIVNYDENRNWKAAIILGFVFATALLIKGSLIFIPFLYLFIHLIKSYKAKNSAELKNGGVVTMAFIALLIPWNVYLNVQQNAVKGQLSEIKSIILNEELTLNEKGEEIDLVSPGFGKGFLNEVDFTKTEIAELVDSVLPEVRRNGFYSEDTLVNRYTRIARLEQSLATSSFSFLRVVIPTHSFLQGHNEYVLNKGAYPLWRFNKSSFYYNDGMGEASSIARVLNFYAHHPDMFFRIIWKKVVLGFSSMKFLWLILLLYLVEVLGCFLAKYWRAGRGYALATLPLVLLPWYYPVEHNTVLSISLLICIVAVIGVTSLGKQSIFSAPVSIRIVFLNFFILTVVLLGKERWVRTIDFMLMLVAVQYLLVYFFEYVLSNKWQGKISKGVAH